MIRKGEMNPFELPTLTTATPHDYAESVPVLLLGRMRPDDPKRTAALLRIRRWLDQALAGKTPRTSDDSRPDRKRSRPGSGIEAGIMKNA